MIDQDGDWGEGTDVSETDGMQPAVVNRPTLHPALPFIGLFPVQESEILVCTLDCGETDGQEEEVEETKSPWIELFLFFQPEPRPVCQIYDCNRATHD